MKKTILIIILSATALAAISYGLYILYGIVMTDVSLRLKEAIAEGTREGFISNKSTQLATSIIAKVMR